MVRLSTLVVTVSLSLPLFYRTCDAFTPVQSMSTASSSPYNYYYSQPSTDTTTETSIHAISPWNLNRDFGASPFGFDINAEIWNGRIAQVGDFFFFRLLIRIEI
jgi:hypothetical protein